MKEMNERFDALHAAALNEADETLLQIAEREQLSDAENARITAAALGKAGLVPHFGQINPSGHFC